MKNFYSFLSISIALLLLWGDASAQTFVLKSLVTASGGGKANGTTFYSKSTQGQSTIGVSQGGNYIDNAGLWYMVKKSVTIIASSDANGNISPSGDVAVGYNSSKTFSFIPNTGYHVDSVFVDGVYVGNNTSYTFTNTTENHTISVTFALNTYSLLLNALNGIITATPDQTAYNHGSSVELMAIANAGFRFDYWSGDGSGTTNPLSLLMDGNKTVTANFTGNELSASASVISFENVLLGTSKTDSIVVTNIGTTDYTISNIASSNPQFTVSPDSGTVAVADSMTFYFTYTPVTADNQTGTFTFTHSGFSSPFVVSVNGTGVTPVFSVSANSLAFGDVLVGANKVDSVTVTNTGTATLNISNIVSDNAEFSIAPLPLISLMPNASQKFYVTFSPTSMGAKTASISFTDDASGSPHVVSVSGTGIAPLYSVSATSLLFGDVRTGTIKQDSVIVTNTGTALLSISSVLSDNARFTVTPTTASIAVGASKTFRVTFAPLATGNHDGQIVFTHTASSSPDTVTLNGNGTAPQFTVSSSSVSFGDVLLNSPKQDSVTVTNTGTASLNISSVSSNNARFTVSPTTGTLAPNASQKYYITFTPTVTGNQTGTISFTNDATGSPHTIAVNGTGIFPNISLSATSKVFGNVLVGQNKVDSVTISNIGTATLNITNITVNGNQYSVTPTSATLAPSGSEKLYITFAPTSTGAKNDTVKLTHNATGSPSKIVLTGTGTAPQFAVSATTKSFGNIPPNTLKKDSVTVTNNGTATLNISSVVSNNGKFVVTPANGTVNANGGTKKFYINYTPTTLTYDTSKITFTHDASGSPSVVTATGLGYAPIFFTSVQTLSFGDVKPNVAKKDSVVITNKGTKTLTISSVTSSDGWFTVTPTSGTVNVNSTKKFYITFTPTNTVSSNAVIKFIHDAVSSPSLLMVNGRGSQPLYAKSKSSISFPTTVLNETSKDSFVITNSGNALLKLTSLTSNSNQFLISPSSDSVHAGATKKYYVTFAPTSSGAKSGKIAIAHSASNRADTLYTYGSVGTPNFYVTRANGMSFGFVSTVTPKSDTMSIVNNGDIPLTISAVTEGDTSFTISPSSNILVNAKTTKKATITFAPKTEGFSSNLFKFQAQGRTFSELGRSVFASGTGYNSPGLAISLDGVDDRIELADSASLRTDNDMTITFWINRANKTNLGDGTSRTILKKNGYSIAYDYRTDAIAFVTPSGTNYYRYGYVGYSLKPNTWYHVAVVVSKTKGTALLYVNGKNVYTYRFTKWGPITGKLEIAPYDSYNRDAFPGMIDELTIWNKELSENTLLSWMGKTITNSHPNINNLVLYYTFNENTVPIEDKSGKKNHGVWFNSNSSPPWYTSGCGVDVPFLEIVKKGQFISNGFGSVVVGDFKSDTSIYLMNIGGQPLNVTTTLTDSVNYRMSPSSFSLSPGEKKQVSLTYAPLTGSNTTTEGLTQDVKVYFSHNTGGRLSADTLSTYGLAFNLAGGNNRNIQSAINCTTLRIKNLPSSPNYSVSYWSKNPASAFLRLGSNVIIGNLYYYLPNNVYNQWHHYTFTISNIANSQMQWEVFIDGKKSYSEAKNVQLQNNFDSLYFEFGNDFFDEFAVWNTLLPAEEIRLLARYSNAKHSAVRSNLQALYRFEEPASTIAADSSGNGRNGILGSAGTRYQFSGAPTGEPLIFKENEVLTEHNFGKVSINTSNALNVTIFNPGNQTLRYSSISSTDSAFTVTGNVAEIAPASSQAVSVIFKPNVYGDFVDTLTMNFNGVNSPAKIIVSGRCVGTTALNVPVSLDLGSIPYGTSTVMKFAVRNNGSAPAIITGMKEEYIGSPVFVCSPASLVLNGGVTDSISVTFTPNPGKYSPSFHKIVLRTENAGSYTIPVEGRGLYGGVAQIPELALNFENAKALFANVQNVTIKNSGTGLLNITGYACSDSDVTVLGPSSIAVGDSGKVSITLIPKQPGTKSGKVYITFLKATANGSSVTVIDSSITFTGTATFGPLTDADNALYSSTYYYPGYGYYYFNQAYLSDSSRISFDSVFTIEMWVSMGNTSSTFFYDKGGIYLYLQKEGTTEYWSGGTYSSGTYRGSSYSYNNYSQRGLSLNVFLNNTWLNFGSHPDNYSSSRYYQGGYDYYNRYGTYGDISPTVWYHLALTWTAGDSLRAYLNGNVLGSAYVPGTSVMYPAGSNSGFFLTPNSGYMDEVMLWKKAKTQEQILRSYTEGIGSTNGMMAYWRFSEGTSGINYDVSGNNHHLINDKGYTYPSGVPVGAAVVSTNTNAEDFYGFPLNTEKTITKSFTVKSSSRNLGLRAELSDTTDYRLPTTLLSASASGVNFNVSLKPTLSTGVKNGTVNFYDLVTNDLVKSVGLTATGLQYKVTGKFINASNSSECINRPISVYLYSKTRNIVVRETTTTCSYEFTNFPADNYQLIQNGASPFYYTLNGKCYRNAGISYGDINSNFWIYEAVNASSYPNFEVVSNFNTTFTSGLAFPASLCSGLMNTTSAGLTGKSMLDTISWTNANEWGGELPSDTQDIVIDYPGFYDQLAVKLDLTELNEYCNINTCTGDVTTIRGLLLADSTTMTVTGNGVWNVTSNLIVNGSMLLDIDSTATLSLGNFIVNGNLTIPEGKNPLIIINGDMKVTGTFNPGNSTIILNGTQLNTISAPLAEGDTTKNTIEFYNLTLNSDSTLIASTIEIANQLTLNANVSVLNDSTGIENSIIVSSSSPEAIAGNGNFLNGTISRVINQSAPASYRFHTTGTTVEFTSTDSLPSEVALSRYANEAEDTLYKAYKGGTVNDENNSVSLSNVPLNGNWTFTSTNYPSGETTLGGSRYFIATNASPVLRVNLAFGYDLAQLNGLDESSLALVKNTSALRIKHFADVDGDNVSDSDRTAQEWEVAVYRDTVMEDNLAGIFSGDEILLDDISFGKYILVPKDSSGWKMLTHSVNANPYPESLATVEIFVPQGTVGEVSYTRYQVAVITASSEGHGTITPSGVVEIPFNSNAEFTIVPDAGYRVDKLLVDGIEIEGEDSFTFSEVSENHTISASFVFDDSTTFRTIAYDVELSKVPAKLAFRNGKLQYPPNLSTAVEAVFKKLGRNGTSFVGIPQASRDSAKKYSWLKYRKPVEFRRMFTKEHSEVFYPIDSTKNRRQQLRGGLRPNRNSYNNKAWEQSILFKLNLLASQYNITPPNFGSLVLDTNVTLFGRDLTGATLVDVSMYLDSVMTYWKKYGVNNSTKYGELRDFIMNVIKPINDGFSAPVTTANYSIDSVAVDRDRNIFAIQLLGVARASDTKLVRLVPGLQPAKITPDEGFENVPTEYALYQNYPNPFNPSTTIEFDLNVDSRVTLKVYNILGQVVTTLVDGETWEAGNQVVEFDATNFASGVYFYRFEATSVGEESDINSFTDVKKMVLIK